MVELLFPFPSFRLGDPYDENTSGDVLGSRQPRASAAACAHERRMAGLESRDALRESSSPGGHARGTFHDHQDQFAFEDPRYRCSVSERHIQRNPGLQAMERGSPSDFPGREKSAPVSATQRAHSERLQMVGAVDKTEVRSAVDQEWSSRIASVLAETGARSQWDFSGLPIFPAESKGSMTVSEVRLIQSIGQGVICTDLEGKITYWNRAAESIYLWKAEEVLGLNVAQLLSPKNLRKDLMDVIGRVSRGKPWSGPYPALRKDGVVINTVVTETPIVDGNNKIVGTVGVSFDASSLPIVNSTIRRSQSDEGLVNEGDKVIVPAPGSDDGKNMLSWRRVHLEAENCGEDSSDAMSSAGGSSNFLRVGQSSVQHLLRKLQIGIGQRQGQGDFTHPNTDRENPREEFGIDHGQRGWSRPIPVGRSFDHSQSFPVYMPNESTETDFGEGDGLSIPLAVHAKQPGKGEGGSLDSFGMQEVVKEIMVNSSVGQQTVTFNQSLSRSSSGSAPGSATARDASSVGSPNERNVVENAWNSPGTGLNFQQAEEDFQLQLALALRVAAEAAAVDDPDMATNVRGPIGNTKLMPGVSKMEATAYRYWVSSCLSYDDRIEDGFYEVWGMSPYVWSMCTDASELGRMPPLDNLRGVSPTEATFEVVLIDRNIDPTLGELEDKAVGLAYESTDVLEMASELSIMVARVMGGAVTSDEDLAEAWYVSSNKLMQTLGTIVLPIGRLRVGLSRHRALLFKVLADSVGLACRLVRGNVFCGKEDDASVVVKCSDEKEWLIDLLVNPGARMAPDKRLAAPPTVIPSPLQFERPNPFAGSSVSVLHWTRGGPKSRNGGNKGEIAKGRGFPDATRNVGSPRRIHSGETTPLQGLDFLHSEGSHSGSNKARVVNEDGLKGKYGLVNLTNVNDSKLRATDATDAGEGNFFLENVLKPSDVNDNRYGRAGSGQDSRMSESPREEAAREYDIVWAREGRRATGSDDSGRLAVTSRRVIMSESSDFEISWDDVVQGERIGQGSYGKVYRADWQGSDVAVKVFLDQDLKTEALEEFKSEVAIMRRLRHPNIVLFMGAVTKPPNLSIITEFCPRGSLYRLLHRPNRELDDRKRIRMAMDVAKGMNYLHRCSPPVVHRDLKSPNLLVDKNWTVKVCDFGLSRQKHSTFLSSKSSAGTPEWMAPEVLRNEPSDEKSDVYSFGVILWELATLQVPWNGMNPIQVVGAVGFQHRRLPVPDNIDRAIAEIIQACWRTDTKLRPSFADLMHDLKTLQQRQMQGQSMQSSSSNMPQRSLKEEDI